MPDPRKFITNTDYPMPFLVYSATYSFTMAANSYSTHTMAHGLPFTPLLIGQWSKSPDFYPSYDLAVEMPSFSGTMPELTISTGADSTNIVFTYSNYSSSSITLYFRLTAFAPPSYTGTVTATDDTSPFRYNSDYNYMKIYAAGSVQVEANSSATVNHGLGYVPQCRIWDDRYGQTVVCPVNTNINETGLLGARITDQTLELGTYLNFGAEAHRFYYQIYADGA